MQLTSTRAQNKFYVDWWLMNHCSWHCNYCHDVLRAGNIALPYIRDCERFVSSLHQHAQNQGKTPQIKFTGGEVTEWADFDQLLQYAHGQGCDTQFRTNASLDRARWLNLMQYTSLVSIGYHPKHTQQSQFLLALKSAVELGVTVMVEVNMLPEEFDELEQLVDYIKLKYPSVHVTKTMRFHDPISNSRPLDYTPIQLVKLKRQHGDLQWDNGDLTDYQELLLEGRNRFQGWRCAVGVEQCVVDAWGRVYRGHCRQGGYMGKISEDLQWSTQPITCDLAQCSNSFDIQATKALDS